MKRVLADTNVILSAIRFPHGTAATATITTPLILTPLIPTPQGYLELA